MGVLCTIHTCIASKYAAAQLHMHKLPGKLTSKCIHCNRLPMKGQGSVLSVARCLELQTEARLHRSSPVLCCYRAAVGSSQRWACFEVIFTSSAATKPTQCLRVIMELNLLPFDLCFSSTEASLTKSMYVRMSSFRQCPPNELIEG